MFLSDKTKLEIIDVLANNECFGPIGNMALALMNSETVKKTAEMVLQAKGLSLDELQTGLATLSVKVAEDEEILDNSEDNAVDYAEVEKDMLRFWGLYDFYASTPENAEQMVVDRLEKSIQKGDPVASWEISLILNNSRLSDDTLIKAMEIVINTHYFEIDAFLSGDISDEVRAKGIELLLHRQQGLARPDGSQPILHDL